MTTPLGRLLLERHDALLRLMIQHDPALKGMEPSDVSVKVQAIIDKLDPILGSADPPLMAFLAILGLCYMQEEHMAALAAKAPPPLNLGRKPRPIRIVKPDEGSLN